LLVPLWAGWVGFFVALTAITSALALRGELGVWLGTGVAAFFGIGVVMLLAPREIGARLRLSGRWFGLSLVIGGAMVIATHVLYAVAVFVLPALELEVSALYQNLYDPPGPYAALPVLLVVVLAEELVFRGLLIALLERRELGPSALVPIGTAFYVMPQLASGSWVLAGLAAVCGALWTWQRLASGSISAPLVTHVIWDSLIFVGWPLIPAAAV
jgi:membrane protease YdiL (CAAX protease family)